MVKIDSDDKKTLLKEITNEMDQFEIKYKIKEKY